MYERTVLVMFGGALYALTLNVNKKYRLDKRADSRYRVKIMRRR